MRLNSVLLPTFGRPTMATTGKPSVGASSSRTRPERRARRGATSGGAGDGRAAPAPAPSVERRAPVGRLGNGGQRTLRQLRGALLRIGRAGEGVDPLGHGLQVLDRCGRPAGHPDNPRTVEGSRVDQVARALDLNGLPAGNLTQPGELPRVGAVAP